MITIGESIKKARFQKQFTRSKLARESGISVQNIFQWENGKTYPNIINLIPIADALNISLDELVGRSRQ